MFLSRYLGYISAVKLNLYSSNTQLFFMDSSETIRNFMYFSASVSVRYGRVLSQLPQCAEITSVLSTESGELIWKFSWNLVEKEKKRTTVSNTLLHCFAFPSSTNVKNGMLWRWGFLGSHTADGDWYTHSHCMEKSKKDSDCYMRYCNSFIFLFSLLHTRTLGSHVLALIVSNLSMFNEPHFCS